VRLGRFCTKERVDGSASRLVALMSTAADAIRSVQGRIQACF
jgi:hypothetical protein